VSFELVQELLKKTQTQAIKWSSATALYKYQMEEADRQIVTMGADAVNLAAAEKVLMDTVSHCSAQTKANIEAFLSLSLQQIFKNPEIKIELLQEVKRDRVETRIVLHEGDVVGPPAKISGGGVQNVLGFLLRFLALRRMNLKPILILDEAFRNVSADHLDTLCSFLKHLTEDHGLDILLVTHEAAFMRIADNFYEVSKTASHGLAIVSQNLSKPAEV
jgi:DNA repair exonuclease SbcCD ATPase subunit